ncbi:AAA family ATPase [Streptomyces sp. JNUCC 64]
MVLVEREAQWERLRESLADCLAGRGGVVAVSGPVASGKTELIRVFAEYAAAQGAVVLDAVARCSEQGVALGVVGQVFGHPQFPAADRERALRPSGEGRIDPCDADLLPRGQASTRVNQVHWQLLSALAERSPVVVTVDDLHFADPVSLDSLIHIGGSLSASRILLVVTECDPPTDGSAEERAWRTPLLRQRHFTRVRVRPLSVAATGELAARLVGTDAGAVPTALTAFTASDVSTAPAAPAASDSLAAPGASDAGDAPGAEAAPAVAWHRLSGGNPLLVRALAEDHRERAAVAGRSAEPVVGEEYGRAVDACVRRAGRRFRDAARALAVLDASESGGRLARLLDEPGPSVDEVLTALEVVGVLDGGRFRHPAARAAVLAGMPAAERAALHRDAARLLHEDGAPAAVVARHLVAGGRSREPWAFAVALEAAREALRRDDTSFAEACLDVAGEAGANEEQRVTVTMLRSLVDFRTDPDTACRRLRPLISALREGRLSGCQSVSLLGRLLWNGSRDELALALRRLERTAETLDPASEAEYHAAREWLRASHPALLPRVTGRARPERPGRPAVTAPLPDGTPKRMADVLNRLLRSGPGPESVRGAELALQTTVLDDTGFDTVHLALSVLVYADRCDLAVVWCDALLREATERDVPAWQALFAAVRAEIAVRQGDARRAERYARWAMDLMSLRSWGVLIGSPLSSLLLASTATGSPADAPAESGTPGQLYETRFGVQYLHARGRWRLSRDLLQGALDDLTRCGRLMREWDIDLPAFVPWRGDAVAVLLRLGRTDEARALAVEQLAMVPAAQPRARGMALRTAAAVSAPRQRGGLLREAVDLLHASGDRLETARALADLSETHVRAGQGAKARLVARRALDIAEENGYAPLARRLTARGARASDGREPVRDGVLSGSEAQVAALAAAGLSNREIAGRLFITVSTVEQHLTHTYRKLRVKGRADLPPSLRALDQEERPPAAHGAARAAERTVDSAGAGGLR